MRAATEGSLPPVMPQGNLVEVLGREVRQGSPGELMVESSPSRQRRPPCKTNKEMSDEAADAAALPYLLTSVGLAGQSEKPAKILSELAEVLACELRQVHHDLGGGNSLSLLRPASLRASGLPLLLLLLPTWVLGVLRVVVLRGRSRSHRRRLIIGGVSA